MAVFTLVALRRDSRDRTRPMMSAELKAVVLSPRIMELVVANLGASVAKDVRLVFDPPIADLQDSDASGKVTPFLFKRYARPILSFTPGMTLRNLYFLGVAGEAGRLRNDEPLPDEVTLTFKYQDGHGKKYVDTFVLNVDTLLKESYMGPPNGDDEITHRQRQVAALEAIARGVGRN